MFTLIDIILFISITIIASIANVLLKIGSGKFISYINPVQFVTDNLTILLGYVLYLIPLFLTVMLYKKFKVSLVQTVAASVYILTPSLAVIVGVENLNIYKVIGIGLITTAVIYIVNLSSKE
ncbi:MAG: hypothetical protein ABI721_04865 [Candidatus Dojkabacteria bacterium]